VEASLHFPLRVSERAESLSIENTLQLVVVRSERDSDKLLAILCAAARRQREDWL
jgi:hypothetical protein